MKFMNALGLFLAAFFLQTSFLNSFRLLGLTPNLVLCLLIVMTFLFDDLTGVGLGMAFCLLLDVQFGTLIGVAPLCALVVFFEILLVRGLLYRDNGLSMVLMSLIATLTYSVLYWLIGAVFGPPYGFFYMLKTLPALFLSHGVVCLGLYLVLRRNLLKQRRNRYI